MLVVSDTSDRIHLGQQPSLARCFVGVSDSTITSFSWLLIEIDTAKNYRRATFPARQTLAHDARPDCGSNKEPAAYKLSGQSGTQIEFYSWPILSISFLIASLSIVARGEAKEQNDATFSASHFPHANLRPRLAHHVPLAGCP